MVKGVDLSRKRSAARRLVLPTVLAGWFAAAFAFGGCGGADLNAHGPDGPKTCEARTESLLTPLDPEGRSSSIALGRAKQGPLKGKTLAFVADADAHAVIVVDVDGKKQIASVDLGAEPGQLVLLPDGRLLVTLKSSNQLAVLHAKQDGSFSLGCSVSTKTEPIGIALAGDEVLVSSGWGRSIEVFGAKDMARKAAIEVEREPRTITISDDGKKAFVSHAIGGRLTVLSLPEHKVDKVIKLITKNDAFGALPDDMDGGPVALVNKLENAVAKPPDEIPGENFVRIASQGFTMAKTRKPAGRLLLPQTLVDPGSKTARVNGYGPENNFAIGMVEVVDMAKGEIASASSKLGTAGLMSLGEDRRFAFGVESGFVPCLLPRDAVIDDASSTLLVACLGVDAVIAYDAASAEPSEVERIRWNVPAGPTGVALDSARRRAVVFSQFERVLQILDLAEIDKMASPSDPKEQRITLSPLKTPMTLSMLLGRQIFHSTGDARISSSNVACASCHVDGREDGLVWASPDGPRRTRSLVNALGETAPYGWDGERKDIASFLQLEFRRLHGQGLRNVQLESLLTYVDSLKPPQVAAPSTDATLIAKGKTVFASPAAGCASCHVGGASDGKVHDIGSRTGNDRRATFDTPSLFGVAGRSPYFHDGRFDTLDSLLLTPHADSGKEPPPLDAAQREALVAYLRSL
ncbi:MAG: c-type cytochrome [Polyangiaceae bacterium]|nr:c-type cytochrome [Polyangiaceae bacterium]